MKYTPILQDRVLPFLEHHQDVASLDKALNSDSHPFDNSAQPQGGERRVLLAHLAHNPEFDAIVERQLHDIKKRASYEAENFLKFVSFLKSRQL